MGIVCSCFASTFIVIGEIFSTAFLAVGEIGAILVRGLFSLIVGLCDVLAACACCCQVPFSQRPDRNGYTYSTLALRDGKPAERIADKPKFTNKSFATKTKLFALPAGMKKSTKSKQVQVTEAPKEEEQPKASTETIETEKEAVVETPAAVQSSWFGGWFSGTATKA